MTSLKQFEANRRNALKSAGPRTVQGNRSRRTALRHGLIAETVIEILEDVEGYKAFEANIIADYDAHTAVERELVLRLASLLWRMRRATSIETDLLRIQAEILRDRQNTEPAGESEQTPHNVVYRVLKAAMRPGPRDYSRNGSDGDHGRIVGNPYDQADTSAKTSVDPSRGLAYCFLRLVNLDNGAFERLGRYETALWRQTVQTLFALQPLQRRQDRFG